MNAKPYLSIILPAYNESSRIGVTLRSLKNYFSTKSHPYEILVINDGSKDDTTETVTAHMGDMQNLRLIDNKENRGKGHAVRHGILEAKGKLRLYMDSDNSVDISHIDAFIPWIEEGYDIVIGSINLDGAEINESNAWYRRLLGRMSKWLIKLITNVGVTDTQRGFKLFTEEAAEAIFKKQTIERFGFDIELLAIARKKGYKIKELPVVWINPAGSSVTLSSYIDTLQELVRIKLNLLRGAYRD